MKPRLVELRRLNQQLKSKSFSNYTKLVLEPVLSTYSQYDPSGLNLLLEKDYKGLYKWADSLGEQMYPSAAKHLAANQVVSLIKKYPWDPTLVGLDPEAAAIKSFLTAEHRCKRTNQWLRAASRLGRLPDFIEGARRWVEHVIGVTPNLRAIYGLCDFSGGANIGVHGDATHLQRKLQAEKWSVTPAALPYLAAALCENFHYSERFAPGNGLVRSIHISENDVRAQCNMVSANKIAFVPKTAKTHRSIAVEPLGNGYLQKGVDKYLRLRLKRVGIDLSDQRPNQQMARDGSRNWLAEDPFCTIDLSSASDSVSIGLCKLLLPPDWFSLLDRLRSPSYLLPDGTSRRYEKFVSMGNGFCFPLESLLFAAIVRGISSSAIPGRDFVVYGDDIIVRKSIFGQLVAALRRAGFRTNVQKTFCEGPFRESCGADWYVGEDVRPFTLDFELDSLSSLFKFANLGRRSHRTTWFLSDAISNVLSLVPSQFWFERPFKGAADTGIDPLDVELIPRRFTAKWRKNARLQCMSWYELEYRPVEDGQAKPSSWVVMAAALRGSPSEGMFTFRRKTKMRVRLVARSGDLS